MIQKFKDYIAMKNFSKIILLSLSLFISGNGIAENKDTRVAKETTTATVLVCSVAGSVIDEVTGEALAGVAVKVAGTDKVAYTDFDGKFSIANLSQGNYSFESSMISYINGESSNLSVTAGDKKEIKIKMKKSY